MNVTRRSAAKKLALCCAAAMLLCPLGLVSGCGLFSRHDQRPAHSPDYRAWNSMLTRLARPDGVRYDRLSADKIALYNAVEDMRQVRAEDFDAMSPAAQKALLINAHNANALVRIEKHGTAATFEKTRLIFSARDARDIELIGRKWSLRDLCDEVMGEKYHDARLIFLLNWAERGCAPLPPYAVTEENLQDLVERQTRAVFADPRYCQYNQLDHIIRVTPLMDIYTAEIERQFTNRWVFLERYLPAETSALIKKRRPRIRYFDWDAGLNAAAPEAAQ